MEFDISIFAQLSMANRMQEELIPAHRKKMNRMIDFLNSIEGQDKHRELYADFRKLKREVINRNKVFYIEEDWLINQVDAEFRHDSFGLCRGSFLKYKGRYCLPIYDCMGDVMGFTGWDKFEDVRYLDSINYGYKAKNTTFYGMEKLRNAYSKGYFVFVEGPVCKLYIEGFGIISGAFLGSNISEYVGRIMQRFRSNCIVIPDFDEAGDKLVSLTKYMAPEARIYQSIVAKDVDDTRLKMQNDDIINEIVNIIKDKNYKGNILKRR